MGDPPSSTDRGVLGYFVLPVEFCAAVALLGHNRDLAWWSTTWQFVGAVVTFGGLLYAFIRAKRPVPVIVRPGTAHLFRFDGSAFGLAPFAFPSGATLEDQLAHLENFVNGVLANRFTSMSKRIDELRHDLKVARTLADSSARKALADALAEIDALMGKLNKAQVLDLRPAMGGLLISAVGVFLQYWV